MMMMMMVISRMRKRRVGKERSVEVEAEVVFVVVIERDSWIRMSQISNSTLGSTNSQEQDSLLES